jgi:hypothetical protein
VTVDVSKTLPKDVSSYAVAHEWHVAGVEK